MDTPRPPVTPELVRTLADFARLPLSDERVAAVTPVLQLVYGLVDQLDGLDLSETPPATGFDARWS